MSLITRRNFIKTAAAGLALPALGRGAFAAEPLKVGFVYLGSIGDWGWTWSHEQGRKAMVNALKGQVVADYVENVKEDASAIPIMKDLAQQGTSSSSRPPTATWTRRSRSPSSSPTSSGSTAPATSTPTTSAPTTRASIRAER